MLILEILIVGQEVVGLDRFRWIIFLIGGKRIKAVETLHKDREEFLAVNEGTTCMNFEPAILHTHVYVPDLKHWKYGSPTTGFTYIYTYI